MTEEHDAGVEHRLAEIERKLERNCTLMETLGEKMEQHAHEHSTWRERISRTLYGYNGSLGLMVRLDRLEQANERQKWLIRVLVGAALALLANQLAPHL